VRKDNARAREKKERKWKKSIADKLFEGRKGKERRDSIDRMYR
jgi:hypothetical protein